jgi:hypothetical protein
MELYFDENISYRIAYAMRSLLEGDDNIKIFASRDIVGLGRSATDIEITKMWLNVEVL